MATGNDVYQFFLNVRLFFALIFHVPLKCFLLTTNPLDRQIDPQGSIWTTLGKLGLNLVFGGDPCPIVGRTVGW